MRGARRFVAIAFVCLGASFLASSALLIGEFRGDWRTMVLAHSHLFFFFPVFGLLALTAFYLPSVVFTDLYWRHLRFGKARFLAGLLAVAALAIAVDWWLDAKPRALWEIAPAVLEKDRGDPAGCADAGAGACRRAPLLPALAALHAAAQNHLGLAKFARTCAPDPMLEAPLEMDKERYCFAALARLKGGPCCEAQRRFDEEVARLQEVANQRSWSGSSAPFFLFFKIFFVLIVVAIGVLLAIWRDKLDLHYRALVPAVERGVIIGAFAMLFWPAMDYGYQQTTNALFGRWSALPQWRLSLVIAPWALLLLFYFLRRLGKQGETIGRVAGVVTAAVAVLRYEQLNDWTVRLLGIGSEPWMIVALFCIALVGFIALFWPWDPQQRLGAPPPSTAPAA